MSEDTALMPLAPTFVVTADEIQQRIQELQQFVKGYMVKDEDYGTIPGTQKPTLYKPGAEKLCDVYGFIKEFAIVDRIEDWDKGRFTYTVKAILRSKRTGLVEAEGLGQCNSMEAKYRWNWVWPDKVPTQYDKSQLVSKKVKGGKVTLYRIPNDDPYSQVNTILKMAKKRALVDAVLSATRSSGLFTQDLEDLRANGLLHDEEPDPSPRNESKRPEPKKENPLAQAGFSGTTINRLAQWIGGGKKVAQWAKEQTGAFKELTETLVAASKDGLAVEELTTILMSYVDMEEGTPTQHAAACVAQVNSYRQSFKGEPIDVEAS